MIDITDYQECQELELEKLSNLRGRKILINPKYVVEIAHYFSEFFSLRMVIPSVNHIISSADATKVADAVRRYNDAV